MCMHPNARRGWRADRRSRSKKRSRGGAHRLKRIARTTRAFLVRPRRGSLRRRSQPDTIISSRANFPLIVANHRPSVGGLNDESRGAHTGQRRNVKEGFCLLSAAPRRGTRFKAAQARAFRPGVWCRAFAKEPGNGRVRATHRAIRFNLNLRSLLDDKTICRINPFIGNIALWSESLFRPISNHAGGKKESQFPGLTSKRNKLNVQRSKAPRWKKVFKTYEDIQCPSRGPHLAPQKLNSQLRCDD